MLSETSKKLVLILQDASTNGEEEEITVHVKETINHRGQTYVPVHHKEHVILCRLDEHDGQEFLTDDLTDGEFLQVQNIYQSMVPPL